jgi:hypothetical protein
MGAIRFVPEAAVYQPYAGANTTYEAFQFREATVETVPDLGEKGNVVRQQGDADGNEEDALQYGHEEPHDPQPDEDPAECQP